MNRIECRPRRWESLQVTGTGAVFQVNFITVERDQWQRMPESRSRDWGRFEADGQVTAWMIRSDSSAKGVN